MTPRERFLKTLNFQNRDKLPLIEWAEWWDVTYERWVNEGLLSDLKLDGPIGRLLYGPPLEKSHEYFTLDPSHCLMANALCDAPLPECHGGPRIKNEEDYEKIKHLLYKEDSIDDMIKVALSHKPRHDRGEIIVRLWLIGFFHFPRCLFGIEDHFFAFYDNPDLMHRINMDLAEYNLRAIEKLFNYFIPDMAALAEDMSYNHGPMLSYECFKEFLLPYYKLVVPAMKKYGVKVFVDSDGDVTTMIPWLIEAGIDGVYPLERQAGVDIVNLRNDYPQFLFLGGFDKMVMSKGENAMRAEFERILPVMRTGGYIPSVDHQTPPDVSLKDYKLYMKLFHEYCEKAAG